MFPYRKKPLNPFVVALLVYLLILKLNHRRVAERESWLGGWIMPTLLGRSSLVILTRPKMRQQLIWTKVEDQKAEYLVWVEDISPDHGEFVGTTIVDSWHILSQCEDLMGPSTFRMYQVTNRPRDSLQKKTLILTLYEDLDLILWYS